MDEVTGKTIQACTQHTPRLVLLVLSCKLFPSVARIEQLQCPTTNLTTKTKFCEQVASWSFLAKNPYPTCTVQARDHRSPSSRSVVRQVHWRHQLCIAENQQTSNKGVVCHTSLYKLATKVVEVVCASKAMYYSGFDFPWNQLNMKHTYGLQVVRTALLHAISLPLKMNEVGQASK